MTRLPKRLTRQYGVPYPIVAAEMAFVGTPSKVVIGQRISSVIFGPSRRLECWARLLSTSVGLLEATPSEPSGIVRVDSNCALSSRAAAYPERERTHHLWSGTAKSHARVVAVYSLSPRLSPMKTNTSPALPGEVQGYVQLQRQVHEALLKEHPEWIKPNGKCPMCEVYESRLAELLSLTSSSEYRSAA